MARDPGEAVAAERMSWHFSLADFDGPWTWMNLGDAKLHEVHQKLCGYEKDTIGQLVARGGNHGIEVSSISKDARERLVEIERDDLDKLWSLRLSGTERVWGIIVGSVFSLLWWDPDHTVNPVAKKHT